MSNNQAQAQMQTFAEAKTSIIGVVQSSFAGLAKMLGIPQLKESFYQNIIYILIVIVIMIGILVYIQMVGATSTNPLFSPPTKEVKQVEIKRVVEGFDVNTDFGGVDSAADVDNNDNNDNYDNNVNDNEDLYHAYDDSHPNMKNRKK